MKVLWICNIVLPIVANAAGINEKAHSAGWIEGFLEGIQLHKEIELGIICQSDIVLSGICSNGVKYWICTEEQYGAILDEFSPDILHVFGTENPESNTIVKLFNKPNRTVVNIQGMARLIGEVYLDGIPAKLQIKESLYEKYRKCGLIDQKKRLLNRGKLEEDTINHVKYVIGRTDIDKMFAVSLNPEIHYCHCNEILRNTFYEAGKWEITKIKRHSILFRSTCNPIKGLYQMLCAMPYILRKYPDAHLYVVGDSYVHPSNFKKRITEVSYNRLLRKTAAKYGLSNNISTIRSLNAEEMRKMFLESHVVVSASVIENESNFVSEAKILGVPVVASFVGGLPNRIRHGVDGFLYPFNMPRMLAYYVGCVFDDDELAHQISKNAIESQSIINDPEKNIERLIEIYREIASNA